MTAQHASICPSCGLFVIVDHIDRSAEIATPVGSSLYVHEGRCPYPTCAQPVFAATESPFETPNVLFRQSEVCWVKLRHALEAVAPLLFAWAMTFGIVGIALFAAIKSLAEAQGAAAMALVLGGPAMVMLSICTFVAMAIACSDPEPEPYYRADLNLRPVPRTYRSV
jgi:hypothetical protein